MAIQRYGYFYDKQIYRYLLQVVRAFSGFEYMTGRRGDIEPQLKLVPAKMAKRSRMVAQIQQNASDNVVNSVPQIAIDLTSFKFDAQRLQNPGHVSTVQVYERKKDPVSGALTNERGNSITVERLMPRPFTMTCQIDLWTSNLDQKFQLLEQISMVIFPTFDIQNSDNAIDWSAITTAHPQDDLTWSSISVPVGNGTDLGISTIQLEIPIWLSPPAKVKRQHIIEAVITNINQGFDGEEGLESGARLSQVVTTPENHCILLQDNLVTLLGGKTNEVDADGKTFSWNTLFEQYGRVLHPAETQLRLRTSTDENAPEIIGTLQADAETNQLSFQIDVDTLPANTLPAINAVIDPTRTVPGDQLPTAQIGDRYLIQNMPLLKEGSLAWGNCAAGINAIIEYKQTGWEVVFDGHPTNTSHFLVNSSTGKQLHWTGSDWAIAVEGIYHPGYWRLV